MRLAFGSPYGHRRSFGGYRSYGGRGLRLILGAVIAIIAVASYFFATSRNPVTGEEQRVASISEAQEVQMGYAAAPEMARQLGGALPVSSPKQQLLQQVGQRLLSAPFDEEGRNVRQLLEEEQVPWEFNFAVLEDDEMVNAFALPGGPVFITEALFDRLENEAQLAGIVGHEIGHVIHRHGLQRIAKNQLGAQLVTAVAVGASGEEGGGYSAAMIANLVNQMFQLRYGREDELESDDQGLKMMVSAGYDPREMVRVMEILSQAGGGRGGPEFLQTHPHPESRIKAIEEFVDREFPDGVPEELSRGRALR